MSKENLSPENTEESSLEKGTEKDIGQESFGVVTSAIPFEEKEKMDLVREMRKEKQMFDEAIDKMLRLRGIDKKVEKEIPPVLWEEEPDAAMLKQKLKNTMAQVDSYRRSAQQLKETAEALKKEIEETGSNPQEIKKAAELTGKLVGFYKEFKEARSFKVAWQRRGILLGKEYAQARLKEAGFASLEDMEKEDKRTVAEARQLESKRMNRVFRKREIREIWKKHYELDAVVSLVKHADSVGKGFEVDYLNCYEIDLHQEHLLIGFQESSDRVFRNILNYSKRWVEGDLPEMGEATLEEKMMSSIDKDYLASRLEREFALTEMSYEKAFAETKNPEMKRALAELRDPEFKERAYGLAKEILTGDFSLLGGTSDSVKSQKTVEAWRKLEKLPFVVRSVLREVLDTPLQISPRGEYRRIGFTLEHLPEYLRIFTGVNQRTEIARKIESATQELGTYSLAGRSDAYETRFSPAPEKLNLDLKGIDLDRWNIMKQNPLVKDRFGETRMAEFDQMISAWVMDSLLDSREHTGPSVDAGKKILKLEDVNYLPVAIIQAFREPGTSGGFPFLRGEFGLSPLAKRIVGISEEEMEIIRNKNIPGLIEIVELIKSDPVGYSSASKKIESGGRWEENRIYSEIAANLARMGMHYFEDRDDRMQMFVSGLLKRGDLPLGEKGYQAIWQETEICLADKEKEHKASVLFGLLFSRVGGGRAGDWEIAAKILTDNFAKLTPDMKNNLSSLVPGLLGLCVNEGVVSEERIKLLAQWKGIADEEMRTIADFSLKLRTKVGPYYDNSFELYAALAQNPVFSDLLDYIGDTIKSPVERGIFSNPLFLQAISDKAQYVEEIKNLIADGMLSNEESFWFFLPHLEYVVLLPRGKRGEYLEVWRKVMDSPSQELQKIKGQLLAELMKTDKPKEAFAVIEGVFIKNNLPLVGKVFKIFRALHSPEDIKRKLESKNNLSPVLKEMHSSRARYYRIYKDLLKIHLQTGNRNLKEYLEVVRDGQTILEKAEEGTDGLNEKQREQLDFHLAKLETLFANSMLGGLRKAGVHLGERSPAGLKKRYQRLRQEMGLKRGQRFVDRIAEMFLKPLGLRSVEEALEMMQAAKKEAHQRGLKLAEKYGNSPVELGAGDLLKGVVKGDHMDWLVNILQNGSVAKEYLGAGFSESDQTPFDTDVSTVLEKDVSANGFAETFEKSGKFSKDYGHILFVVKNRGQFQKVEHGKAKEYNPEKLELFSSGDGAYGVSGIRTGFPITEVDFMVAQPEVAKSHAFMERLYLEIAQNGYYIPVVDNEGKIIFTPEIYEKYRSIFNGLNRFDGSPMEISAAKPTDRNYYQVQELKDASRKDKEAVKQLTGKIRDIFGEVLRENNVELKSEFDAGILGAELMDTGSTGRFTNIAGSYDFDLALRLDNKDFDKVPAIVAGLKEKFNPQEDKSHGEIDFYQMRAIGSTGLTGEPLDIDIGFVKKSELLVYGSHDAVSEKLEYVRKTQGPEAEEEVIANVVLAKKVLKEGKAYKKFEEGGLGGIGVENWILQNKGNMLAAFRSFRAAAHDEQGQVVPLEAFRYEYKILDPGFNVKKNRHDNFTLNLTEEGYKATLSTIEKYFGEV